MKRSASHAGSWYVDNSKYTLYSTCYLYNSSLQSSFFMLETKLNEELTHYFDNATGEGQDFPIQGTRAIIGP